MRLIGLVSAVAVAASGFAVPALAAGSALVDYGSISGRVVSKQGEALRDVYVELRRNSNYVANTSTAGNGKYQFPQVEAGVYTIKVRFPSGHEVWYDNADWEQNATPITVNANANTVVNVTRPPVGNLNIKVIDQVTRQVLPGICFYPQGGPFQFPTTCSGADGVARLRDFPVGTYDSGSFDQAGIYENGLVQDAVITEGATARVTVRLRKWGKINVSFVDSATGDPAGACVHLADAVRSEVGEHGPCGTTINLPNMPAMDFRLFVSTYDGVHGAQWVGSAGGTGDPAAAQRYSLTWGQQLNIVVRLDGAGSITGRITDAATGAGVSDVCPSATAPSPDYGPPLHSHCTSPDGYYTIRHLGPYAWKLAFPGYSGAHAWAWSGGAANRDGASALTVVAAATLTHDVALAPSGVISGRVTGFSGSCYYCATINAIDADTGDYAAVSPYVWPDGTYTMKGLNAQNVWVEYAYDNDIGPVRYPQQLHTTIGNTIAGIDLPIPQ